MYHRFLNSQVWFVTSAFEINNIYAHADNTCFKETQQRTQGRAIAYKSESDKTEKKGESECKQERERERERARPRQRRRARARGIEREP
jgi:hypothetical protein